MKYENTNLERESLEIRLGLGLLEYLLDLADPGLALLDLDIGLGLLESLLPSDLVVEWTLDFLDGD